MTTPGGDIGEKAPSGAPEPVAVAQRRSDWLAVLAWSCAAIVAIGLAGLATIGFQVIGAHRQVIDDWWKTAVAEAVEGDGPRLVVEPLPGVPPTIPAVSPPETDANGEGRVIVSPTWLVTPQSEYPTLALRQGVESGRVELQCPVTADGHIPSCWILSETPAGAGFGQAALVGAVQARLQPGTVDGEAVDAMIRYSVAFRLE
ncbi:energy transducer TonB [uncultured Brevundimonas sp.]|uniref:energy transducer TonB n=1 Tax=uncultured Brevundimonas sp. TaxID=213418 RepID=UPI0030EB60BD|tara:strand:- start:3526 stop:4131 length:606 start_codon:yes stop_codon:yes gene_type:complete